MYFVENIIISGNKVICNFPLYKKGDDYFETYTK